MEKPVVNNTKREVGGAQSCCLDRWLPQRSLKDFEEGLSPASEITLENPCPLPAEPTPCQRPFKNVHH